jgi:hypothetical protein
MRVGEHTGADTPVLAAVAPPRRVAPCPLRRGRPSCLGERAPWQAGACLCSCVRHPGRTSAPTRSRTHVHALARVTLRRCWAPPPRCCVSPVFRRAGRDLASRPNHRWASCSRPCSSVRKMVSPPHGAPPLSTSAALSLHRLVVAQHRVHLFAAACPCTFTHMHSLASELPRHHGYPSRNAAELEPHQAVTVAPSC